MASFALPLAISGISALSGLLGNRSKKQTLDQTQTQNINEQSTPTYDPYTESMKRVLSNWYLDRVDSADNFFQGYRNQGISDINRNADLINQNIQNSLAGRGLLGTSAGANSQVQAALNRGGQLNTFLNSIPLLQDERNRQNLNDAASFFAKIPYGQSKTGTTTQHTYGTQTTPGNMLGGAFGGLANSLFGLYGAGAFDKSGGGDIVQPRDYGIK